MNIIGTKIVLDTNVFITILAREGANRWIFDKVILGEFILCLSNEMLMEYWEVMERKMSPSVASNVVEFLISHPHVHFFTPHYQWNLISSDAEDNKFIDCYLVSGAQHLVSNDRHFDVLRELPFPKISRFTTSQFEEFYENND